MNSPMTIFILAFIAGAFTIITPCVFPLLPVIIGGSATDAESRHKPYIIIGSLAVSVLIFTLVIKVSTVFIAIDDSVWKLISGGIVLLLGLAFVFPKVWEWFTARFQLGNRTNQLLSESAQKKSVAGDVLMGAALGPVFSTCSPTFFFIIGVILPEKFAIAFIYILSYILGLSLVLLAVAIGGQKFVRKMGWATSHRFRLVLGLLFVVVGVAIMTGYDKKFEAYLLEKGILNTSNIEQQILDRFVE